MSKLLSEAEAEAIRKEPRFYGIEPVNYRKERLLSFQISDRHIEEMECLRAALQSGTGCRNVQALEEEMAGFAGGRQAVAFGCGTAAVHMALKLAAEKIYGDGGEGGRTAGKNSSCGDSNPNGAGKSGFGNRTAEGSGNSGVLWGKRVFCSDLTSSALVSPVVCEGAEPVFIDASPGDWGMDPDVLETAFGIYPDVKIVMMAHVYGFPGQAGKIKKICERHGALLIEDACESIGAAAGGKRTGSFGDYGVLSFHHEDVMPDLEGGMLFLSDPAEAETARRRMLRAPSGGLGKRCGVPGYHRRMSEAEAGIIRNRMRYLDECTAKKKAVYERYRERFAEDLMQLNPIGEGTEPDYRTSCMTVESSIGFKETRTELGYEYVSQHGTAAPMEILEALAAFGAEAGPVWKPMHMQTLFKDCDQISLDGSKREYERSGHNSLFVRCSESEEIFRRGICLPSDIRMTGEEQERIIDIIFACYSRRELERKMWCAVQHR